MRDTCGVLQVSSSPSTQQLGAQETEPSGVTGQLVPSKKLPEKPVQRQGWYLTSFRAHQRPGRWRQPRPQSGAGRRVPRRRGVGDHTASKWALKVRWEALRAPSPPTPCVSWRSPLENTNTADLEARRRRSRGAQPRRVKSPALGSPLNSSGAPRSGRPAFFSAASALRESVPRWESISTPRS